MMAENMFAYDETLLQIVSPAAPQSIPEVLQILRTVDAVLSSRDGLKWFNWLYLSVTSAIQATLASGRWNDRQWICLLDAQFAKFYFNALAAHLRQQPIATCWEVLLNRRNDSALARIQFALAGINAHINHDLPQAIVVTYRQTSLQPTHGSGEHRDFVALNSTIDSVITQAKGELKVRLGGDPLPPVNDLENRLAAWSVSAAREAAWTNGEVIWGLRESLALSNRYIQMLDGMTQLASKALLSTL